MAGKNKLLFNIAEMEFSFFLPKYAKAANQDDIEKQIKTRHAEDAMGQIPENPDGEAALSNNCDEIYSSYREAADWSPLHGDGSCSPEMLYDDDDSTDNEGPDQIFSFEAHSKESMDADVVGDENADLQTPMNKEFDTDATPPNKERDTKEAIDVDVIGDQVTKTVIQEIHAFPERGKEFSTGEAMENHKNPHTENSQTHIEESYYCKEYNGMEIFSSKTGLDEHRRNNTTNEKADDPSITPKASHLPTHVEESYNCKESMGVFSSKAGLDEHRQNHTTNEKTEGASSHLQTDVEESYNCKESMEVFSSRAGLDKHRRNHTTNEMTDNPSITPKASHLQTFVEESYNCKESMEVFSSETGLDEHRQNHTTNEKTEDPSITPKASRSEKSKKLTIVQSKTRRHICDKCEINFSRHCNLINHIKMHHDVSPEIKSDKEVNGKVTRVIKKQKSSDKLEQYSYTNTEEKNDKPVCDKCGMRYAKISQLINHMKKVHKEILYEHTESALQCKICSKWFSTQSSLQRHSSIHTGNKPYKCPKCPKHFRAKFHMEMHCKIHTGILYKCDICSKCFTLKSNYVRHYKVHTGENDFTCAECGKSFRRKDHMELHVQVHLDVGYKCEICLNDYATLNGLKRHQLVHSSEKRHVCSMCGNSFRRKDHLDKHIKNIHKKKAKK